MCCWNSPAVHEELYHAPITKSNLSNITVVPIDLSPLTSATIRLNSSRTLDVITPRELISYRISMIDRTSSFTSRDVSVRNGMSRITPNKMQQ